MSATSIPPSDINCPVCFDRFGSIGAAIPVAGPCLHNICKECFDAMPKKNCPTCREPIPVVRKNCQLLAIIPSENSVENITSLSNSSINSVLSPSELLERAAKKAHAFIESEWAWDSAIPNHLTPRDLDLLWDHETALTEAVFTKIYERLANFYTNQCKISEKYKLDGAKNRYNQLCHLVARPKAVAENNPVALFCYAHCLFHGINVPKDVIASLNYYKLAAEHGIALAIHMLAVCCCEGYGTRMNTQSAVKLFKRASSQNCLESMTELGKCLLAGNGTKKNTRSGLEKLEFAADLGHIDAMVTLGDYYSRKEKNYLGCDVLNLELAAEYYIQAIERGCEDAEKDLHRCLKYSEAPVNQEGCTIL